MQLFLWFTLFSVLVRTALTFFNVPYLSLGAELSQDYQERTQIVAVRIVLGAISILGITAIGWNFFFVSSQADPTPQLTRQPYLPYAIASSLLMIAVLSASTLFTARAIPHLAGSRQQRRDFGIRRVYQDLYEALHNDSFRALFVGTLIYFIYAGTQGALWMHLMTFYWQLDTKSIQWIQYAGIIGAITGVPLAPSFNRWFDKKWSVIVGIVVSALCDNTPIMFKLAGAMPGDPATLADVLIALSFIGSFFGVQASITVASMMGDVADEHELKHGTRQEGVYFGSYSFSSKCTGAFGNMIAGVAIDLIGLNPASKPGEVAPAVLNHFGASYGLIALLILGAIWVFLPYSLNSKRHAQVLAELAKRRAPQTDEDRAGADRQRRRPFTRWLVFDRGVYRMKRGVLTATEQFSADGLVEFAQALEMRGYDSLWLPELFGREPIGTAGYLLGRTRRICIATGIANVYVRDAHATAQARQSLAELSGGRFILGLGVSNAQLNASRGHTWQPPLQKMTAYLDAMDAVKVASPAPAQPCPTYIAAHGPQLQKLGAARTDGVITYLMTPQHARQSRARIGASAATQRRCDVPRRTAIRTSPARKRVPR